MKQHNNLLILYIISLFLFSACSSKTDNISQQIHHIDKIMNSYPDSAMVLLEKIDTLALSYPDKMQYTLLYTQACDKNYITHTSIIPMSAVAHYYDSIHGDISLRMKSHYYLGRVYQDIGDDELTVKHFIKAITLNEQCSDSTFSCMLFSNMGYIYYKHNLLEEADSLYNLALNYTQLNNQKALILCKLGKINIEKGDQFFIQAENALLSSYKLIENSNYNSLKQKTTHALSSLYRRTNRLSQAIDWAHLSLKHTPIGNIKYGIYLSIGTTYYKLNQLDSAIHYLNKSLHTTSYGTKESSYLLLSNIAEQQGDFVKALHLNHYSQQYKDSSMAYEQPIKIIKSVQKNLRSQLTEQYEMSLYQYKYNRYILLTIVSFLILIIVGYRIYKNKQYNKVYIKYHHILNNEQLTTIKLCDLENQLKEYKSNHRLAHKWLEELIDEKNKTLTNLENIIHDKNQLISQFNTKQLQHLISSTDIYKRLQTIIKYNMTNENQMHEPNDDDWNLLEETINQYYPNFMTYIIKRHTTIMTEDLRFLSLIKLGFSYKEIQYINNRSLDSIYKRDKSVKTKLKLDIKIKLKEYIKEL